MARHRFQRGGPQLAELAHVGGRQQGRRVADVGGQLVADHDRVDVQRRHRGHVRVVGSAQRAEFRRGDPAEAAQRLRHVTLGDPAEVVEAHLTGQFARQLGGGLGVQVAQQAVADALVRHREQLLLDRLDGRAQRGSAGERGVDVDAGQVEPDGVDRGEPADGARQIGTRHHVFLAAVALQADQQRILAPCGHSPRPPLRGGQRQRGEQAVVHAAVEQRRNRGEQGLGDLGGHLDPQFLDDAGSVQGRVHRTFGQQRIGRGDHRTPVVQLGHPLGAGGLAFQRMRPGAHRGGRSDQLGCLPRGALTPGRHEVRHQDAPGDAVHHQVVGDDDQASGAFGGIGFQPDEPDHHARGGIEPVQRLVQCGRGDREQVGIGGVRGELGAVDQRVHLDGARRGGLDDPVVAVAAQARAQHVVPIDDRADRRGDARPVDADRQFQRQRLVEPPERAAPLRHEPDHRRQRHRADAAAGRLGQGGGRRLGRLGGLGDGRQPGHGALLEDVPRGEHHAARLGPRDQLNGDDAVAAEREEGVVHADPLHAEHLGEHLGDGLFDRGAGRAEHDLGGEHRFRQRLAVQFAHRGERHVVDHHDRRGHHVGGQAILDVRGQRGHVDRVSLRGDDVRHQRHRARGAPVADGDREVDGLVRGQRGVDLAELDAETAHLHLEVGAAYVFDNKRFDSSCGRGACGVPDPGPADHVTGAVHPCAGHRRVGDEPLRRQARPRMIATRQLDARQIQLTRDTHRNGPQLGVQDQRLHAAGRATDGDPVARRERVADVGHDRGLGRAVAVVEAAARTVGRATPLGDQIGGHGFTTGHDHPHAGQRGRIQRGEHRRGDERVGDPLGADQLGQLLAAVDAGRADHQGAAAADREQEFQDRGVEAGRGEMQCARVGIDVVAGVLLVAEVGQTGVGDHDALGHTGGTGGVDDVRGVLRPQRAHPVGVGDRGVVEPVEIQFVEHQPFDRLGQLGAHRGHGETDRGARIGDHVRDAVGRVGGVDRHERAAGLGHRPFGEVRLVRARHGDRHQVLGADATFDQQAGQAVGPRVQLAVGDTSPLEHHGGRLGIDGGGLGDQVRQRPRGRGRRAGAREQVGPLGGVEHVDRADGDRRVGRHRREHTFPAVHDGRRGGLVEQLGGVGERQGHGAGTGVTALGEGELQVEARDVLFQVQRGHRKTWQLQGGALQVLERQHHLEQRVAGLRALRREQFHQPLERHVGVAVGVQVGAAHTAEQVGERLAGLDAGAQHQGVDEHADQVVERGLAAARDRGADRDVVAAGQARQQHRQRTVHHHEQRRAALPRDLLQRRDQVAGQLAVQRRAAVRGDGRTRAVGRQGQLVGDVV
ncbi:hypothetical protein NG2371_00960 [Nocardia gamkensis]|nr:hypothetical protein [Nocardia gamkensis]